MAIQLSSLNSPIPSTLRFQERAFRYSERHTPCERSYRCWSDVCCARRFSFTLFT